MEYRVASLRSRTIISSNDFVDINQLPFRSTLLKEQADPGDDFRRTGCVFHDSRGSFPRLLQIGLIARKPAQAGIGVGDGGGNRLIHFVRQGGRQLSHGGHPADVRKIRLRLRSRSRSSSARVRSVMSIPYPRIRPIRRMG